MHAIFDKLETIHFKDDLFRNIKSIRKSQDLYDDLSDDPIEWQYAIKNAEDSKPRSYLPEPIINRPFDEAYFQAIMFIFQMPNWKASRFSAGNYGVWYGALDLITTIHETVYHWRNFLKAADLEKYDSFIIGERRVFQVKCEALLLDFRNKINDFPQLIDAENYQFTQNIGEYIQGQGHPGLFSCSARCEGTISVIFTPKVLKNPRDYCYLTYTLDTQTQKVIVERKPKETLLTL